MPMLLVSPDRVDFGSDIAAERVYKETITVTNTLSSPVVFSLRTSAPGRLSVTPAECSLEAGETASLQLKLNVTHPPAQKSPRSYRDIVFLQSTYFQQKVRTPHSAHTAAAVISRHGLDPPPPSPPPSLSPPPVAD